LKKASAFSFFVLLIFLCTQISFASFHSTTTFSKDFISTKELHAGMIGYGKTVFHGTQIETFKVKILGILKKAIGNTDLILVRIESPYLEKRGLGLVAGMSGSPVYFNGKLAGAIAYGWPFTKEPIAGVTPIKAMLTAEVQNKNQALALGSPKFSSIQTPVRVEDKTIILQPLDTPLCVSGFDSSAIRQLKNLFPMTSVVPAGGKFSFPANVPLVPGQSVGAALMQGDMNVVATGTLTYRNGNRILAFGHPFLFMGDVDFPLVESYVHYILPSLELPFKFVSPIKEIGHVAEDRLYGIGGVLGFPAHMVPIDMTILDQERNILHHYHVDVIQHPNLTPKLAALAIQQAIPATAKLSGGATAAIDYTIRFKGFPAIHKKDLVFSEDNIPIAASTEILKPIFQVVQNEFQPVPLQSIKVNVKIKPGLSVATIQKIALDKQTVKPGGKILLHVWLKPYNGKTVVKSFSLNIPNNIEGTVSLGVSGGIGEEELLKNLSQPPAVPQNVNQIIKQIQREAPNNALVIAFQFPRSAMNLDGESFSNFPESYINLLKSTGIQPLVPHPDGVEFRYSMPWVVLGNVASQFYVGEGLPQSKPQPPQNPPQPPPPPTEDEAFFSFQKNFANTPSPNPLPEAKNIQKEKANSKPPSETSLSPEKTEPIHENTTHQQIYATLENWQKGSLKNLAIDSNGDLVLAPKAKIFGSFGQKIILAVTENKGTVYVGTASPGKIYAISSSGQEKLFFNPHTSAVLSLASLPNGDIAAGTIDGKLCELSPEGKTKFFVQLPLHYIWQILPLKGKLYLACGNPTGEILRINEADPTKKIQVYATTSSSNLLSLYPDSSGAFFAGTDNGFLLKISPDSPVTTVADLGGKAVLSIAGDEKGNLYFGTEDGKVFRLNPSGIIKPLASFPEKEITWLGFNQNKLLAATGIPARLYAISQNGDISLVWDGKTSQAIGLKGDDSGKWFVYSGSPSTVFKLLSERYLEGSFTSDILDEGSNTLWGTLSWKGDSPQNGGIQVQTRSGNTPIPDSTWSAWSNAYPPSGKTIKPQESRYLQFRVLLSHEAKLSTLSFFWRPMNHPPSVVVLSPQNGEAVGPKSTLKAKILDPDGDTILVQLIAIKNESENEVYSKLYSTKPNLPQNIEIPLSQLGKENGALVLKLIVSDSPSNPPQWAFSTSMLLKDLTFVTTPPTLEITSINSKNGFLVVNGTAQSPYTYIKAVEFQTENGAWFNTIPENGLFDASKEDFMLEIQNPEKVKTIKIRAVDAAGNETQIEKNIEKVVQNISKSFAKNR
jgi:hypothetical protein